MLANTVTLRKAKNATHAHKHAHTDTQKSRLSQSGKLKIKYILFNKRASFHFSVLFPFFPLHFGRGFAEEENAVSVILREREAEEHRIDRI